MGWQICSLSFKDYVTLITTKCLVLGYNDFHISKVVYIILFKFTVGRHEFSLKEIIDLLMWISMRKINILGMKGVITV